MKKRNNGVIIKNMPKLKGTPLNEIIIKNNLKRCDIVLIRSKKGIIPKLIRFGMKSYWNHIALIFVIRNIDKGFNNTFIIESSTGGIDIHNFYDEYLAHPKKYDIGIKRFNASWLNNNKKGLEIRKLIRGSLLNAIDCDYDYNLLLRIGKNLLNNLIFIQKLIYNGIKKYKIKPVKFNKNISSKYICSGYVQNSIYTVINNLIKKKKYNLGEKHLNDIIFNPLFKKYNDPSLLLSTTPADFANSDKLNWLYIIKNGKAYKINNNSEVKKILVC